MWVCMNWLFLLYYISGTSNLHDLFDMKQAGSILEDPLSDFLTVQQQPEDLEGCHKCRTFWNDFKKNMNN